MFSTFNNELKIIRFHEVVWFRSTNVREGGCCQGKEGINDKSKYILLHLADNPLQYWAGHLVAGVHIELDEVGLKGLIEHEIEAKHFKTRLVRDTQGSNWNHHSLNC